MKNIAILASGNGSNAQKIIEYFNCTTSNGSSMEPLRAAKVTRVICNRANAYVLERAKKLEVPATYLPKEELTSNPQPLLDLLEQEKTDYIVLAGYLLMIPQELITRYSGKIINIHPSLLPSYGGKGMYGSRVHEAVIAAKEKKSGITIHLVDEKYDSGAIIFQAECPVLEDDTPDTLAERIHALEYTHFPRIIEAEIKKGLQ